MSVFIIVTIKVKNPEKFAEYGQLAGPSMAPFGGEVHLRGKFSNQLSNVPEHSTGAILKFPDIQSAKDWYASPAYQEIIPIRDEGADVNFALYEQLN
jgi:uncharacterized protein (DUF1330 family)